MKLSAGVGLAEGPSGGRDVVGDDGLAVAGGDLEREALPVEIGIALPILAPIPGHRLPGGPGAFDGDGVNVASAGDVSDEDEVEVGVAVDGEPHASASPARNPSEGNRDNTSSILSYFQEDRFR